MRASQREHHMRRALLFVLFSIAPATTAAQAPLIPLGSRVRVETQQRGRVDGTLMSQTEDSIVVAAPGALRTVVVSASIARIRVSEGRSRARGAVRGMKIGAAVGGGSVALVFGAAYIGSTDSNKKITGLLSFVAVGVLEGVMVGAGIGALVGAEAWTTVYSRPIRVGFQSSQSGAPGVGVSITF